MTLTYTPDLSQSSSVFTTKSSKFMLYGSLEYYEKILALKEIESLHEKYFYRLAYTSHINQQPTDHFLLTNHNITSNPLNKRKVGYASHSFHPYRAKFPPTFIRSLLNIMNVKEGMKILDPFVGSGTTTIESYLLNLNSYGIDVNPTAIAITRGKIASLLIDYRLLTELGEKDFLNFFEIFYNPKLLNDERLKLIGDDNIYYTFRLAYLETISHANKKNFLNNKETLFKYFLKILHDFELKLRVYNNFLQERSIFNYPDFNSNQKLYQDDMFNVKFKDNTFDVILTSPPYSSGFNYPMFDYIQNKYLNTNINEAINKTLGLKGKTEFSRIRNFYFDMRKVIEIFTRITKDQGYICLIIGKNPKIKDDLVVPDLIKIISDFPNLEILSLFQRKVFSKHNYSTNESIIILKNNK